MEETIRQLVEEIIQDQKELFVVDVKLKGHKGAQHLLVTMDGDNGIQIDMCALISRKLGFEIEERGLINDKYNLEVSSAGLDAPLKLERQYHKNVGRQLKVITMDGEKIKGKLTEVKSDEVVLETEQDSRELKFIEIDKSKVVVSFK